MVWPVCVLQVPESPLLSCQEVFDLHPRGGVAARLCAEPRGDLEATVRHRVVPRAESGPVAVAFFSPALLKDNDVCCRVQEEEKIKNPTKFEINTPLQQ